MVDGVVRTDAGTSWPQIAAASQVAVLAGLAAIGTLATNILLPSLPQMARALCVSSAAVTSSITVFFAMFALVKNPSLEAKTVLLPKHHPAASAREMTSRCTSLVPS